MSHIIGWHLELSRRCTLKCPACPRTYNFDLIENSKQDLDFSDLKTFFQKDRLPQIKYLFFQGNLGEPILHPEFHEIAEYFFDVQHLSVITNGIQSVDFWTRVLETWPENSLITLSIDGLEDTNSIYRVGAPWAKINGLFDLIARTKRRCKIEWKYLVFEHNEHQIDEASKLARQIGIDSFRIQQSRPLDQTTSLNGQIKTVKVGSPKPVKQMTQTKELVPFCKTLDLHYINAKGEYYPCCWWPGHYQELNQTNDKWSPPHISSMTLDHAFSQFQKFSEVLKDTDSAPQVCRLNCTKNPANLNPEKTPNSQVNRKFLNSQEPTWES